MPPTALAPRLDDNRCARLDDTRYARSWLPIENEFEEARRLVEETDRVIALSTGEAFRSGHMRLWEVRISGRVSVNEFRGVAALRTFRYDARHFPFPVSF